MMRHFLVCWFLLLVFEASLFGETYIFLLGVTGIRPVFFKSGVDLFFNPTILLGVWIRNNDGGYDHFDSYEYNVDDDGEYNITDDGSYNIDTKGK
jgi:hypothetical protein